MTSSERTESLFGASAKSSLQGSQGLIPLSVVQFQFSSSCQRPDVVRVLLQLLRDDFPKRFGLVVDRQPVDSLRDNLIAIGQQIAHNQIRDDLLLQPAGFEVDLQQPPDGM